MVIKYENCTVIIHEPAAVQEEEIEERLLRIGRIISGAYAREEKEDGKIA